jgi:hypothetical protein
MSVHQNFTVVAGPSVSTSPQQSTAPQQSASLQQSTSPQQTSTCGITPSGEVISYRQVQVRTNSRRNSYDFVLDTANAQPAQATDVPGSNQDLSEVKPFAPGRSTSESVAPRAESPEVWVDIELQDWPTAAQLADTAASMPSSLPWYSHPMPVPVPVPAPRSCTAQSGAILSKLWGQTKSLISGKL